MSAAQHVPHVRTAPLVRGDTGPLKPFSIDDLDADPVVRVQEGYTLLHGWNIHNTTAADAFLLCYSAAAIADVTVGTTVPDYIVPVGANAILSDHNENGIQFPLGLCIASTTTTGGSTDAAQDINLSYR